MTKNSFVAEVTFKALLSGLEGYRFKRHWLLGQAPGSIIMSFRVTFKPI